ncbi:peptidoglycan-binding domain-containing protein [Floridanema aerugineum]|uniref:Peptidoglycan-binding protein n=1 Tax=Floridaenema aerugineum BLCC-F46 TaxID=3153654 RepID=A0ABV4X5C0_9CYAN
MIGLPTLQNGSSGDAVLVLQRLLTFQSLPTTVDGIFGPKTEEQVKAFQTARKLALVDGVVGPITWQELSELS